MPPPLMPLNYLLIESSGDKVNVIKRVSSGVKAPIPKPYSKGVGATSKSYFFVRGDETCLCGHLKRHLCAKINIKVT